MDLASVINSAELHIKDLPNEVLQHIFIFLPYLNDRKTLSLVCQRWNDLAFDYRYMSYIRLKLTLDGSVTKLHKIARNYRAVHLRCNLRFNLDEDETEKLLTCLEKLSSSLEELVCNDSSRGALVLRLLSTCSGVKKFHLESAKSMPYDKLPVLEKLEELTVTNMSGIDIVHLAPNLRKLHIMYGIYYTRFYGFTVPMMIQKLPLEQLRVTFVNIYPDLFKKCTKITKLTSLDLLYNPIDQIGFEKLCKLSPMLTKLRVTLPRLTSLRCLASLTNVKVLVFDCHDSNLFENNGFCLPNLEIVAFSIPLRVHFDKSMQRLFPNVHYLQFNCNGFDGIAGKISTGFPQLTTLELLHCKRKVVFDLLEGLSDLRELIVRTSQLSDTDLPLLNVQQLTLKDSELLVTKGMAKNLPKLQFLNLFGDSRCSNVDQVTSGCTVRRYLRDSCRDIFDVI